MKLVNRIIYKFFKAELTYSQAGEDGILKHLFDSINRPVISYLDIGTNHPIMNNNTYLFYQRGGQGVCVEPNPDLIGLIRRQRPRDKCVNVGIGTGNQEVADFYSMSSHTLSTFSKKDAEELDKAGNYRIKKILQVPLKDVNSIIQEYFSKPPDLVSIDVEGWNEEIIESFDFNRCRPFCFCVETINFSETKKASKLERIFSVFEKNQYAVFGETHLNTIFVDRNSYGF